MKNLKLNKGPLTLSGKLVLITIIALFSLAFTKSAVAKDTGSWKWKSTAEVETTFSSNLFNLSKAQQDGLETNNADDQISGRYTDMESVYDLIVSPAIELSLKNSAASGNDTGLKGAITYKQYLLNTEKSYPKFDFEVEQKLGFMGSIAIEVTYKLDVFKKNYLSDADDGGIGAIVTPDERVYTAGIYDSLGTDVIYSNTFWRRAKGSSNSAIKRVDGNILAGIETRTYDSPFSHRDSDTLRLGAGLDIELSSKTDLEVSYLYESIDIPVANEVMIRDEPDFGLDGNGDGDALDQNVRIVQAVDRSRVDHNIEVKAGKKLTGGWDGKASYSLRFQKYDSKETFDITRQDRTDTRHTFALGLARKYSKKLSLDLDWKYTTETASRSALADLNEAEDKPYNKHVVSAVLQYKI